MGFPVVSMAHPDELPEGTPLARGLGDRSPHGLELFRRDGDQPFQEVFSASDQWSEVKIHGDFMVI